MLSVLIPTYNYTCYQLVADLQGQLSALGEDYEVIVAEDGSRDQVSLIANWKINDLPHCRVIRRKDNCGRAAIRNFLAREAKGEWLLFMDSDGIVCKKDFIQLYIDSMKQDADIVCGGISYPEKPISPHHTLRWRYETAYEKDACKREFRSFCFMIRRKAMEKVCFDENFRRYGYEDVRFGKELEESGFKIVLTENPLMCGNMEDNRKFLEKTEEAMRTLKEHAAELEGLSPLLGIVSKLRAAKATWLVRLWHCLFGNVERWNLLSTNPNLTVFRIYKLGYFISLQS